MRRVLFSVACLATMGMLFTAAPALAQSPHFVSGPSLTCNGVCAQANFKVAGLGSTTTTTPCSLSCSALVTGQCYTKNGNPVQGTTKSGTASGTNSQTCPVHNGTTSGPINLCPANLSFNFNPGCTGQQNFVISSADYSACTVTVDGISQEGLNVSCPGS
jgi:hypothetical protein